MNIDYKEFFQQATGQSIVPYHYQLQLATEPWPGIVNVPTGMGKTAAIILSWLYKRAEKDASTPRRLVYCLPMRVLVEQTAVNALKWISHLAASGITASSEMPTAHVLMGGEIDRDWDMHPETDAILIGTQDQLLSRALNRGYAMSRFRWPVHFGLLNNDCLWVFDEVQLMGSGLATAAQMQAFRNSFGTVLPTHSIWMSATLNRGWLDTVDFHKFAPDLNELVLTEEDTEKNDNLKKRFAAKKPIFKAECPADDYKQLAEFTVKVHKPGTRTLVVINKIKRAKTIYDSIQKMNPAAELVLLHSQFRLEDRARALEKLLREPSDSGTICVATQVIEAGVDTSACTLISDLAPWVSMVQRFGRCNREGLEGHAKIFWLALDTGKKGASLPYAEEELQVAASILEGLSDVGPKNLPSFESKPDYKHVLRSKDILELFDTTPDLAGADIDVSRFIRESEDHDVQVFWRDLPGGKPGNDEPSPNSNELCNVSLSDIKAAKELNLWRWDHLYKEWVQPAELYPGLVLMLQTQDGCYSSERGWTGDKKDIPHSLKAKVDPEESNDDDLFARSIWQSLAEHNDLVVQELRRILAKCPLPDAGWIEALNSAARWHDVGKAHDVFQQAMVGNPAEADEGTVWAKTARNAVRYERPGFRHELASALAMLQHKLPDLAVYLAAAHHGKVRLSIRSLPNEKKPPSRESRFARGIWDGDRLRAVSLGEGRQLSEISLDLSFMEFGDGPHGPSWLARMIALRDDAEMGPFRLSFLEALLRAADWRGSKKAIEDAQ